MGNTSDPIRVLQPQDVFDTLSAINEPITTTILDPWYNRGVGGERADYDQWLKDVVAGTANISENILVWGFPDIVCRVLTSLPAGVSLVAWLTWYYKNCPSVIRGWRSAQYTCLHLAHEGTPVYPEHFMNQVQLEKMKQGKMRFVPGPPTVMEVPLNIGWVGKKERANGASRSEARKGNRPPHPNDHEGRGHCTRPDVRRGHDWDSMRKFEKKGYIVRYRQPLDGSNPRKERRRMPHDHPVAPCPKPQQPNGNHEHRASKKPMDPENSCEGMSAQARHSGMIRYVNADGETDIARHGELDTSARPQVETRSSPAPPFRWPESTAAPWEHDQQKRGDHSTRKDGGLLVREPSSPHPSTSSGRTPR